MRINIAMILVLGGIWIGMPQRGYADGECTPNKLLKESFNEAVAAEKSGNLPLAFEAYQFASGGSGCEGPNPSSKVAQEGWKRAGQRLSQEAEAKGNLYSNGSFTEVTRPSGLRLVLRNGMGAFHWYKLIDESAGADRVMLKYARSRPKDLGAFHTAVEHLSQGYTFQDLEKQAKSNPGDKALQDRIGYLRELEKIALKNIDEELAQEEKAFNSKQTAFEATFSQKNKPAIESQKHVMAARDWYNLFSDPKGNKVVDRAERRADALTKNETPQSLSDAEWYYNFAEDAEKVRKVAEQA
ncbi:MAG: hypothetical protein ACREIQ_04500, partial [Nitrospiria bacterium]